MEKISDEEIRNLNQYIKEKFRSKKLWFSYLILEKNEDNKFLNKSLNDIKTIKYLLKVL